MKVKKNLPHLLWRLEELKGHIEVNLEPIIRIY